MSPESYFRITQVLAPIATVIAAVIFSYGALRSRFRLPLAIIAIGSWLLSVSGSYWLVLQARKVFGAILLSRAAADAMFPVQGICYYIGLIVVIVGDVMLVWRLSRHEDAHI
jgi:hypothetical protein